MNNEKGNLIMLFFYLKLRFIQAFKAHYPLSVSLMLSALLLGCAQTPKAPELQVEHKTPSWISELPQENSAFFAMGSSDVMQLDNEAALKIATENAKNALNDHIQFMLQNVSPSKPNIDDLTQDDLEQRLRARVRQNLTYPDIAGVETDSTYLDPETQKVYVLVKVDKLIEKEHLMRRLTTLDAQLGDYVNSSQKGSQLDQLLSLAPVLPTLEARNQLRNAIDKLFGEVPELPNEQMALMMDRQITKLFNSMIISVDALTAETEKLEPLLVEALSQAEFKVSARRPDLTLKYYIEMDKQAEGTQFQVTLTNDIEFINRDSSTFATFNQDIHENASTLPAAQQQAMLILASKIKETILQKIEAQIIDVNKLNFER
ncbi:MAG: hypothetical protein JXK16_08715 [Thiotrichales bacterium]|nr:hypothetical protein [Thiotrichales bacterium]